MTKRRAFLVVLDSVGCGAMPDADSYGDAGANTLSHVAASVGGLNLPNLARLGLGCACEVQGVACPSAPIGIFGRMAERSVGKDTTTGHWELMGLPVLTPFPTYPAGFPAEVMDRFSEATGYGWVGNVPASGTEIIQQLGEEHIATRKLIVYTSADSVFQIAAHEDVVPVEELYRICEVARRDVLHGEHAVARVIARPFIGDSATGFTRTARRHDYSVAPWGPTALDVLRAAGVPTFGVGKISDIFGGRGLAASFPTISNDDGMDRVISLAENVQSGLVFANLVDFDMVWGHRRDVRGYATGLEAVDGRIGELLALLQRDDLLIVTADHGCDPTHSGSDHTREYVPLLVTTGALVAGGEGGGDLGTRLTFADVGATLLHWFGVEPPVSQSSISAVNEHAQDAVQSVGTHGVTVLDARHLGNRQRPTEYLLPEVVLRGIELVRPALGRRDELFLVGGLLRDLVIGHVSASPDIDLVLNGDLGGVLDRLSLVGGIEVSARNRELRTARITETQTGITVDLAEARAEAYGGASAYPERTVGVPLEWDLARRDFTMNALALPVDSVGAGGAFSGGDIVDLYGGVADIRAKLIRVLHDQSFEDDPTRVLRALKFAHRLGFTLDSHTAELASQAISTGAMDRVAEGQLNREVALLAREWKE